MFFLFSAFLSEWKIKDAYHPLFLFLNIFLKFSNIQIGVVFDVSVAQCIHKTSYSSYVNLFYISAAKSKFAECNKDRETRQKFSNRNRLTETLKNLSGKCKGFHIANIWKFDAPVCLTWSHKNKLISNSKHFLSEFTLLATVEAEGGSTTPNILRLGH